MEPPKLQTKNRNRFKKGNVLTEQIRSPYVNVLQWFIN